MTLYALQKEGDNESVTLEFPIVFSIFIFLDLAHGFFKTVFAELLMLDVLKLFSHFLKFPGRESLFPRREDDSSSSKRLLEFGKQIINIFSLLHP